MPKARTSNKTAARGASRTPPPTRPSSAGDESAIAELRAGYITEANLVGSVPNQGQGPQIFIDKLGERLAFERVGTRLYEALIGKVTAADPGRIPLEELELFHDQEAQHFRLVAEAIEELGGDPTVMTPAADVTGVEGAGLMQVVTDPQTTVAQSLHALLVAELADNAGWDELVLLAEELGHRELARQFGEAREHEREHLEAVRTWHQQLTLAEARPKK